MTFNPFATPISSVIPITEPQLEIWLSCTLGGDQANMAYNESNSLHFTGVVDVTALERALAHLIARHESLRSSFSGNGKYMIIYKELPNPLRFRDLSGCPEPVKKTALEEVLQEDAVHAFNLIDGPLFRATLLKLDEQEYHFIFTGHHLVIDGWSIGVVMQELGHLYSAFVRGEDPMLPLPKPYSEFAIEQKQFLETKAYQDIERFWLTQFKESVPVLSLPTDQPRPQTKTYKSSRLVDNLDPSLVTSLRKLGVGLGGTFVNTLMTAFEVFLYRITGDNDVIIGLPSSGQAALGYYDLVGHCVNLLPIRSKLNGQLTFAAYLTSRKPQILDAYEHQRLTFGSLLKKLKIARDSSRIPLVPVMFNVDFGKDEGVDFHGLDYEMISNPKAFLNFELFLNVNGSEDSVVLEWTYNNQLFTSETMRKMMDDFTHLLQQMVKNPEMKLREFPLTHSQLHNNLARWNDTAKDLPTDTPFVKLIHETALKFPKKTAIEFFDRSITYKELNEQSNQFAAYLIANGIQTEDIIGVFMERCPTLVVVLLGISKAGGTYLPLDPEYPQERISYMLTDSKAKYVITHRHLSGNLDLGVKQEAIEDILVKLPSLSNHYPDIALNGDSLAYILYTSGSTGNPKGVQIEHRNLTNFLLSMQIAPGISSEDRLLAITTISFDIAGLELFLPLITGATIVMADTEMARDGRLLLQSMQENEITFMQATPSTWRMLKNAGWNKPFPIKALCGGEGLPEDLKNQLLKKCDSVWNVYGPTETTIWSTAKELHPNERVITIGRPIANTQVYLLNEDKELVPEGQVGEIYIGGMGVARGYLHREDLTLERFFDDPFTKSPHARMYRTGDLGKFLPNGEIVCLGRVDQQVKIRGHRIELGEIEQHLVRMKEIKEAVVLAREDSPGQQRLAAYLIMNVPQADPEISQEQISEWKRELQQTLPSYMIPNDWAILERFPLTSNNKIDRKSFPRPETPTDSKTVHDQTSFSPNEELVARIWSQSLGVDSIGLDDDFFEMGGHSLIAVEVMTKMDKASGVKLPLSILFEYPTIRQFSTLLESKEVSQKWKALVPIKPLGDKTPLYIVHGRGLNVMPFYSIAKHLDPDQPLYGLQAIGLNGKDESPYTIEDIAAQYVNEIITQNPNGPYALAGYSLGGIVAYEMAQQFKNRGKKIAALIMFDTYAARSPQKRSPLWRMASLMRTEMGKRWFDLELLFTNPRLLKRLKKDSFLNKASRIKSKLHIKEEIQPEILKNIDRIKDIHVSAANNYKLQPYDGEIHLFRAKIRTSYERDFKYFGWKPFVKKVNVIEMEGEHTTMFEPPHEQQFVEILQKILSSANAQ